MLGLVRQKTLTVSAEPSEITKALCSTARCGSFKSDVNNNSFKFTMRLTRGADGVVAPVTISGTILKDGTSCILHYRMRPSTIYLLWLAIPGLLCLCAALLQSIWDGAKWILAFSLFSACVLLFSIPWRETIFEERIQRKMNEITVKREPAGVVLSRRELM